MAVGDDDSCGRDRGLLRVLIVDDEEMIRSSFSRLLNRHFEVETAGNGAEALELMTGGRRFDLVLCDLLMPLMNGIDLFSKVKDLDPAQAKRFVFLSGGVFTPVQQQFLALCSNPRLEKPIGSKQLLDFVRAELERQGPL